MATLPVCTASFPPFSTWPTALLNYLQTATLITGNDFKSSEIKFM
jgi:hypothetical protein